MVIFTCRPVDYSCSETIGWWDIVIVVNFIVCYKSEEKLTSDLVILKFVLLLKQDIDVKQLAAPVFVNHVLITLLLRKASHHFARDPLCLTEIVESGCLVFQNTKD